MKKFLKLTTVVVSMVMALAFVSCANGNENGNENGQLNLVGTYGLSKLESYQKDSKEEMSMSITITMPTSTSLRKNVVTQNVIDGEKTSVYEMDVTITKTGVDYSFNWAKYNINGKAASEDAKKQQEGEFNDKQWNEDTALFAMTYTTTADGTWSDNNNPASSGTYTVDEANSKVKMTTLIENGKTLKNPVIEELTYSNNGKTLVFVEVESTNGYTNKKTMTFTRK